MVSMKRIMSFENSPVPLSIFSEDGCMLFCNKSQFMHKLEDFSKNEKIRSIGSCDGTVYDGHATIQVLSSTSNIIMARPSFKDMAYTFTNYIFQHSRSVSSEQISQIHVVFYQYALGSTKNQARGNRRAHHIIQ